MKFLVILDTMWGTGGRAPRWFHINPQNHSGRRLYALTGARYGELYVTNACPQQTTHATRHGRPDAGWLAVSLRLIPGNAHRAPLLVCGAVAQRAYERILARTGHVGPVYYMKHPAARTWTRKELDRVRQEITAL